MKVYISADMEGIAGLTAFSEVDPQAKEHGRSSELMTGEVLAACEGAVAAGATDIVVKDAHWLGRNILVERLPKCARVARGWSGHPYLMMDFLDESFAAALMIGYHSRAGSGGNPMSHTLSSSTVSEMRLNGQPASEFLINTYTSIYCRVPMVFLSGDQALCSEVQTYNEKIAVVETSVGRGRGNCSLHPEAAKSKIFAGVKKALQGDVGSVNLPLPNNFDLLVEFKDPSTAYNKSFFPGAHLEGERTLHFHHNDYFEVLRALLFIV